MIAHPDQQVQELLNMLESQRDTSMIECANLRIANKDLAGRLAVAEAAVGKPASELTPGPNGWNAPGGIGG